VSRRLRVEVVGAVQGVGFRPFVFRLASELGLRGWVLNGPAGVVAEVEGPEEELESFSRRIREEAPPRARIRSVVSSDLPAAGFDGFEIRYSETEGQKTVLVLPDLATCPDCLADVLDEGNRRAGYPFTNCTNCGPRFTIVRSLPYDRPNTTMSAFPLCPECLAEYGDPRDRRFHAQPNACPACGPKAATWDPDGTLLASGPEAVDAAAHRLAGGGIVAVKGVGGFHLLCDARDAGAVDRLRVRKGRPRKPFALMVRDLAMAREVCRVPEEAIPFLGSPEGPIVLMERRPGSPVAGGVAPGNPDLGVMLPSNPLHHLLLRKAGIPLVATSGNRSEEPICTDEREAVIRLGPMADLFLVHDRPIERHADDSVVRVIRKEARVLRRARGYAPFPVFLDRPVPPILAVGAHLKNTVALSVGREVFISQHIGDLETEESMAAFERVVADFRRLWEVSPVAVAHDLHPGYLSTAWARESGIPLIGVQHHHAHLAACLAENGVLGEALGVTWDGTGYGTDRTVWGGEFLSGSAAGFRRLASLRPFRLPGGEAAVREPRRVALALLLECLGPDALGRSDLAPVAAFSDAERNVLASMLERGVHTPVTTSAGRLFDGVASLLGLCQKASFEGEAAMALEAAASAAADGGWSGRGAYPLPPSDNSAPAGAPLVLDWVPTLEAVLHDLSAQVPASTIASRFHDALASGIVSVAERIGQHRVALTGGCFQNRVLTERTADLLEERGFEVLLHREIPPGDGGISLGQVAVAAATLIG
jgi:hydrogenase maturation protein HypF